MEIVHHQHTQGSPEWFACRLGIPTASALKKIITPAQLKVSSSSVEYADTLVAEWILQGPIDGDEATGYMKAGIANEDKAASWFAFDQGLDVETCGFFTVDDRLFGASPDRLVGEDALLEIKCPAPHTHVKYRRKPDALVTQYRLQVYGQMIATGRRMAWLLSWHPTIRPLLVPLEWEPEVGKKIETAVTEFVADLDARKQAEDPAAWKERGR